MHHACGVPNCPTTPLKKYINLKGLPNKKCGVIDTACTIFAFENRSYLGEFEAEFKKALARQSGAQGVLFDEK
jgi:ATP-dependent Clp protease ATP-binding subunit ClpA